MTLYIATRSTTGLYTLDSHIAAPFRIYGFHHHDPIGGGTPSMELAGALFHSGKKADITAITPDLFGGVDIIDTAADHGLSAGDEIFLRFTDSTPAIDGYAIVNAVITTTQFDIAPNRVEAEGEGFSGEVWLGEKSVVGTGAFTTVPIFSPNFEPFGQDYDAIEAILVNGNETILYYKGS